MSSTSIMTLANAYAATSSPDDANDELYLMSTFGKSFKLNRTLTESQRFPPLGSVVGGLVNDGWVADPSYHARRSRTAVLLDSLAEICVQRKGDIFAVGLVVPPARVSGRGLARDVDPFTSYAEDKPTFFVAANAGVPTETRTYLTDIAKELRRLANKVVLPEEPSNADPNRQSPRPELSDEQIIGKLS
jgi:hypothetical protein